VTAPFSIHQAFAPRHQTSRSAGAGGTWAKRVRSATLALLVLALAGCGGDRRPEPAPAFQLPTLTHGRFALGAQRGKVTVLVFWTTDCTICKQEMLDLKEWHGQRAGDDLVVAAVCMDPEQRDALRGVVADAALPYDVLLDRGGAVGRRYGVKGMPTTVIVGRAGRVRYRIEGYDKGLARKIRGAIAGLLASERA